MAAPPSQRLRESDASLAALIVSEIRFLRESLSEVLSREDGISVCGSSATAADALVDARALSPDLILLDVGLPGGVRTATRLAAASPSSRIIALAVAETTETVLAWAEAGIAGYVPNTASLADLSRLIGEICRGEQSCPSRIACGLLRRVGAASGSPPANPALTRREQEILRLVAAGLSNKDIARHLGISLGTAKSHVHNLLTKLSLTRRTDAMLRVNGMAAELAS